jgi:sarcosine/dimethylglycine N-methyltransferase
VTRSEIRWRCKRGGLVPRLGALGATLDGGRAVEHRSCVVREKEPQLEPTATVAAHYGREGLLESILKALGAAGKDPERLAVDDLVLFDQFHLRGRDATLELLSLAGIGSGDRVLDVGGGIGGPARTLAGAGCSVTVLDLTEEFCRAGVALTERVGLASRVTFRHGSALAMPFENAAFDAAWTQHSSMNVEDKERLYGEIARVLRTGGRLAMHEIMAGPQAPLHFPVPWAGVAAISFLRPPEAVRKLIQASGFRECAWRDVSETSLAWLRERLATPVPPPLGLHLLLGAAAGEMLRNVARNLEEHRITVVEAVFERGRTS